MKILVVSDSHGDHVTLGTVINREEVNTDTVVHLGDGKYDITYTSLYHSMLPCVSVCGNMETYKDDTVVFEEQGVKIMCTHGHAYGVKGGLYRLAEEAYKRGADLVLYGHTHIPNDTVINILGRDIRLFNPGSIGRGYPPSYGIIRINNGIITAEHIML